MTPTAGPQLPSNFNVSGPQLPIGPSFPSQPSASTNNNDSDSEDDYGPSLPPEFQRVVPVAVVGPSLPSTSSTKIVQGPTMPPNHFPSTSTSTSTSNRPTKKKETPLSNLYSDDDDDDVGPMPLPQGYQVTENEGVRAFREREEREEEKRKKEQEGKGKLKREEWMLVPPKDVDLMSMLSADTTKLKSRTFAQSGSTPSSGRKDTGPNLWTETPAERQERLQDELLGKRGKAEISAAGGGIKEVEGDDQRRKRVRDVALREEVERHNKSARSSSLLDSHSKGKKESSKKDGPPGIWDRDRDMSVGGRLMDDGKRADIVQSAKELGSKFGKGSYL